MKTDHTPAITPAVLRRRQICSMLTSLGLLAIAVAIVIPLLAGGFQTTAAWKWLYAAGAAICLGAALFNPNTATNLRDRRWQRIEAWSAIFFAAGAAFIFVPGTAPREWLALTLAGAALRIITFIRGAWAASHSN